jgi:transcriptional regulator with XRE-family HTH domain
MNDLAARIRALREQHGWNQADRAEAAGNGLDRVKVNKIEGGTRKLSSMEFAAIAEALHVRTDDLLQPEPAVSAYRAENADSPAAREAMEWFDGFIRDYRRMQRLDRLGA